MNIDLDLGPDLVRLGDELGWPSQRSCVSRVPGPRWSPRPGRSPSRRQATRGGGAAALVPAVAAVIVAAGGAAAATRGLRP